MTRTQQIVQQLARVSGTLSIHEGVATLDSGEQINFREALAGGENNPTIARRPFSNTSVMARSRLTRMRS